MCCASLFIVGKEADPGPPGQHIYIDSTSCKDIYERYEKQRPHCTSIYG